jgi:hypothetical protein
VQPTRTPVGLGTVVRVEAVASAVQALKLVSATCANAWNPAVYDTAGAIRIGTGNTTKQFATDVEVFSHDATGATKLCDSKL